MVKSCHETQSLQPLPPGPAGAHILTSNDRDILRLLARYRYLRASFIDQLLPDRSSQGLSRSLRRLFDHGYIDKPREQHRGYNSLYCPDIYELDEKGEGVLLEEPREITRLYRQKIDAPLRNFAHSMMICDAWRRSRLGLLGSQHQLITWQEIVARTTHKKPMKLPCNLAHTFPDGRKETNKTFLIPDGLFGIRHPDNKVSFFALECEHYNPIEPSNLKRASFLKKVLGYRDIQRSGVYKTQLAIPNLRVLVVAPTQTRMDHMMELAGDITAQSNLFLFIHVPVQEELLKAPKPFPSLMIDTMGQGRVRARHAYLRTSRKRPPRNRGRSVSKEDFTCPYRRSSLRRASAPWRHSADRRH